MPPAARQDRIACSGSSQVENATGGLPCLRREKRSSSAAATVWPSTRMAAAGSWKTALTPRTFIADGPVREALLYKRGRPQNRHVGDRKAANPHGCGSDSPFAPRYGPPADRPATLSRSARRRCAAARARGG